MNDSFLPRKRTLQGIILLLALLSPIGLWPAQTEPSPRIAHYNVDSSKLAMQGYDPVAYHTLGQALPGSSSIAFKHDGVTYRFATEADRNLFSKNPDRYAPAYGGWCATAMVKGEKVSVDPKNFKVTDGRLYLFFKAFYADARKDWLKDELANITQADAHWKTILAKPRS